MQPTCESPSAFNSGLSLQAASIQSVSIDYAKGWMFEGAAPSLSVPQEAGIVATQGRVMALGPLNLRPLLKIGRSVGGFPRRCDSVAPRIEEVFAFGASVIEKHFSLGRNPPGPDYDAATERYGVRDSVRSTREVEASMVHAAKQPAPGQFAIRVTMHQKTHTARRLREDTRVIGDDFANGRTMATYRPKNHDSPVPQDTFPATELTHWVVTPSWELVSQCSPEDSTPSCGSSLPLLDPCLLPGHHSVSSDLLSEYVAQ